MGRFGVIWSGHLVTLVGNSVLRFAFVLQAWASGEQAVRVVLVAMCAVLPQVLLSPTAGALVDRCRKRTALQLADLGGLVTVAALSAVYFSGHLQLWEIYLAVALLGAAAAFQYPAFSSAVPLLVRKEQLQRANGLLAMAKSVADICGPPLAAVLIAVSGLRAILLVDLVSFVVALVSIRVVRLADEQADNSRRQSRTKLTADSLDGLRYLFARPSLRGLTLVIFTVNLVMVFGYAVVQPMVLARTDNDTSALASVMTSLGAGGVVGGLVMGAWGGPRSRVRGMMLGIIGMCLTSQVMMAAARDVIAWCAALFAGALLMPIINGTMQAIIQTKVPPERHGRVFGAVMFVSQISLPVAMGSAGVLADQVFEPQASAHDGLVGLLQPLIEEGRGSGMATMLMIGGVLGIVVAVWGLVYQPLRDIDVLIPDLDSVGQDKEIGKADMTTNPFEDENGSYLVLVNDEDQHSLWPADIDVPAGWRVALPASSRAECLAYVEETWTDMRPASITRDS